jgi:predicted transcriptional regulator
MDDESFDIILGILENPIRRRILAKLSKESHYPLQLSKELNVSQQAIMKHLKVMEEHNIIECFVERGTGRGPPRKCYIPTKQFSLRIDIGPNLFEADMYSAEEREGEVPEEVQDFERAFADISKTKQLPQRLNRLSSLLRELNEEIDDLERTRARLVRMKEQILKEANSIISKLCDDYEQRKLLYYIIEGQDRSLASISEALDMRMKVVEEMVHQLSKQRIWSGFEDDEFF